MKIKKEIPKIEKDYSKIIKKNKDYSKIVDLPAKQLILNKD